MRGAGSAAPLAFYLCPYPKFPRSIFTRIFLYTFGRYNASFMYLIECVSWYHDHECFGKSSSCKKEMIPIVKPLRHGVMNAAWLCYLFCAPSYSDKPPTLGIESCFLQETKKSSYKQTSRICEIIYSILSQVLEEHIFIKSSFCCKENNVSLP